MTKTPANYFTMGLLVTVIVACCSVLAYRADDPDDTFTSVLEKALDPNGQEIVLTVVVNGSTWNNGKDCGDAKHQTTKNGLRFNHTHFPNEPTLPQPALDQNGNDLGWNVEATNFSAYYRQKYNYPSGANDNPQVTRAGSITFKHNCWGYALGYSTWINDPSNVFSDDYDATTNFDAGYIGRTTNDVHGWKVEEKCIRTEQLPNVKKTSEKFRVSEIFTETYQCGAGFTPSDSSMYKLK